MPDHVVTANSYIKDTSDRERKTYVKFDSTPPVLPKGFHITELEYRGKYSEIEKIY